MVEKLLIDNKQEYKDIYFLFYLPNMTHILQVLDLVLNGPLKKYMRGRTALDIFDYFRRFLAKLKEENVDLSKESEGQEF